MISIQYANIFHTNKSKLHKKYEKKSRFHIMRRFREHAMRSPKGNNKKYRIH